MKKFLLALVLALGLFSGVAAYAEEAGVLPVNNESPVTTLNFGAGD